MSMKHYHRLLLPGFILLWAILACGPCGWLSRSGPKLPDRSIEITEEAAQRFQEKLREAAESQGKGPIRLQFSDQELTSFINLRLEERADMPLVEPRIWFTQGKIYMSGELHSEEVPLSGRAVIVASAQVADGRIQISIDQATIGRVPIPRAFLDTLSQRVNDILGRAQLHIKVERLEILEGEVILLVSPAWPVGPIGRLALLAPRTSPSSPLRWRSRDARDCATGPTTRPPPGRARA